MSIRDQIILEAYSWLRTPFHHHGRVKGAGVDCLQLLIAVYSEVGLLPQVDPGEYAWDWHFHKSDELYLAGVREYSVEVQVPKPGDAALFKFGRCVSHAAIVVEWPLCIHSYVGQGVVEVDAVVGAELKGRLHSFWSLVKE